MAFYEKQKRKQVTSGYKIKMSGLHHGLLREAALLQRMRFWRLRALHGPLGNCSKSRGVKNYLALVRKHAALAEKAGLRETDIYG
jgi:hypothetical protein